MLRAITFLPFLSALLALALAALVALRHSYARPNQLLAAGLVVLAIHELAFGIAPYMLSTALFLACIRIALGVVVLLPPIWLGFGLTFGKRDGKTHPFGSYPALLGLIVAVPLAWAGLAQGFIIKSPGLGANGPARVFVDHWGKAYFSILLVGLALVLLHLENLYRNAETGTRWRIKFLVVGIFVPFSAQIVAASYVLLYGVLHPWHTPLATLAFLFGEGLIAFSLVRHRLLQVDVFVSRYVVFRSLTLALVGGYLVALGMLVEVSQWLDIPLDLTAAIILGSLGATGLTLILLSEDVRRRLQRFLHTHFYKYKYDYRVEWMEFTRRLSRATAIPDIATRTVQRILDVMWVRQVAMYTTTTTVGGLALAHQVGYDRLPAVVEFSPSAVQQLRDLAASLPGAVSSADTLATPPEIANALRDSPVGIVIPVLALDTLAGLLVVGPEVSGTPFGVDDKELLAAIAAQAGAMIVNARLVQEASEGRDLQVLARLSAFVAHDLKNSVGMLSLLVDNAPHHMHDPEFQTDALRTLTEVTGRMQRLLAALRSSNHQPAPSVARASVAPNVEMWLRDFKPQIPPRITLESRLEPTPDVAMPPEHLHTLLANLVVNAIDATSGEGRISVETHSDERWAILVVADTGTGMSAEFIRDRLFRPFQTTKARGLGIGLFQCRHIIQSLGGELSVESHEGVGTRMTVRLPAASAKEELVGAGRRQRAAGSWQKGEEQAGSGGQWAGAEVQ